MASTNRVSVQEFEDIAVSLEKNKSSSFMNDESVKKSYESKSRSFITAHDIGSDGPSPSNRKRVSRSVSSLGDSIMGLSEAEEEELSLPADYLQLTAYECLLITHGNALSDNSVSDSPSDTTLNTLHSFRKGLSLSEAAHDTAVSVLKTTLARVQGKVPAESIVFRLYLIDTLVSQAAPQKPSAPSSSDSGHPASQFFNDLRHSSSRQSQPELRHLAIFSCAMQFAIKKACREHSGLSESQSQRLSQQLLHDTKKLRSRLLVFHRNPTIEGSECVKTIIAGMVVRYTQYPFVKMTSSTAGGGGGGVGGIAVESEQQAPYAPDFNSNSCANDLQDDLVVTDGPGQILTVLNVSGDQDDDEQPPPVPTTVPASINSNSNASPIPSITPSAVGDGCSNLLDYTFPLNTMIYATLFQTFFVELEESELFSPKSVSRTQLQHGVYRSRKQDTRMKSVVDVLTSFRSTFGISFFMHASCFIHVVFTEHLENSLPIPDLYKLLSIDCYFYPGFRPYCQLTPTEPDEILCRNQVLTNMKEELVLKLGDYHAQMSASPEDLLFVAQLYSVILQKGGSTCSEEPDKDEIDNAIRSVEQQLGSDVAEQVREQLEASSGMRDRSASGVSIRAYCEIMGLVVSSTIKHYIRVKHKVVSSRRESGEAPIGMRGRTLDLWLSQLNSPTNPTQERRVGYSSSMSNNVASIGKQRLGASRLVPGQKSESPNPAITLTQVNNRILVSSDHVRYLIEVLLLEVHSDVKYYSSNLICVLPSAVQVVLQIYCNLLSEDMKLSMDTMRCPTATSADISNNYDINNADQSLGVGSASFGDSGELKLKADSPTANRGSPPPPRRSSSPPLPIGISRGSASSSDDIVTLSVSITNMVYTLMLLQLLRANIDQYTSYFASARDPPPYKRTPSVEKPHRSKSLSSILRRNTRTTSIIGEHEDTIDTIVDFSTFQTTLSSGDDTPGIMSPLSGGGSQAGGTTKEFTLDALYNVQIQLQKRWKNLVDSTLELYVLKVVAVDNCSSVGVSQEASISSSCVDLTLMANRIAVLVVHGIEISWESLQSSKDTISCAPSPPADQSSEALAQYFMMHCEGVISSLEDDTKAILNNAFRKYVSAIANPVNHASWNMSETLDPRFIRSKFGWLFKSDDHALNRTALRANNVTFVQRRMHDIYTKTISGYQHVVWKLLENQQTQPETAPISPPVKSTATISSPLSVSTATGAAAYGLFDIASLSLAETTSGLLLKFMATKITCFDLYSTLQQMYNEPSITMNTLLDQLEGILTTVIEYLSPGHRSLFLAFTLSAIAQITSARIVRGKMIMRQSRTRFEIFREFVEDLHAIREFFINRDSDGNPTFLQEKEVESLTACVLSTLLVLLSRNPGMLIKEQASPHDGLPINILYTKDQVQGMMMQIAGRSYLAHNLLLEALEVQREMELQESWDEQRTRLMMLSCKQTAEATDGGGVQAGKADRQETKPEKKVVSRTCSLM
eukprot:TRINITY_DN4432_c0_g1_i1.p1 TRINITY_DN4432_c0_g1~~TRINITY_DN4432_c0_g1_i1.p1  ORF type:complete len:1480 (+),score=238.84 TRINITY_DN4432_c0_g1_i1:83-4522(+)